MRVGWGEGAAELERGGEGEVVEGGKEEGGAYCGGGCDWVEGVVKERELCGSGGSRGRGEKGYCGEIVVGEVVNGR